MRVARGAWHLFELQKAVIDQLRLKFLSHPYWRCVKVLGVSRKPPHSLYTSCKRVYELIDVVDKAARYK